MIINEYNFCSRCKLCKFKISIKDNQIIIDDEAKPVNVNSILYWFCNFCKSPNFCSHEDCVKFAEVIRKNSYRSIILTFKIILSVIAFGILLIIISFLCE